MVEDTQTHAVVPPPEAVPVETGPVETGPVAALPPEAGPPPPPGIPPRLIADAWPWMALLGILAIAGLLLWLFVFRGDSKGRIVPAVVGLQQQAAIEKLTGDGFGVRALVGPAAKPRGIVVSQKPGGGSRLDKGQTVVIHVSNGRRAPGSTTATTPATTGATTTAATTTEATPATTAAVPDVGGQDAASGAGQVEAAGFVAETDPVTTSGTAGSIVQQDPAANAQADAGSVVRLSVATGSDRPAKQVPDLVGQKASAARAALLDATLTVKTIYKKGPAKNVGVVAAQSPPAGGSAPAYTQITITVGS